MVDTINTGITRADLDGTIPEDFASSIIDLLPRTSTVIALARKEPMGTKTAHQPVLTNAPKAQFLTADDDARSITTAKTKALTLTAEECSAILPIPNNVLDDSSPAFTEAYVRSMLAQSIGEAVDNAALFAVGAPAGFPKKGLVGLAEENKLVLDAKGKVGGQGADKDELKFKDLGQVVAEAGDLLASKGVVATGFASRPGLRWELLKMRADSSGVPIYGAPMAEGQPATMYGYPLAEGNPEAWDIDRAKMIVADWDKVIVGVRKDIEVKRSEEGTYVDENNKTISAIQRGLTLFVVNFRVAFQIAEPRGKFPAIVIK